jgi:ribosomal protein S18 acetylase RimI-like enzyme
MIENGFSLPSADAFTLIQSVYAESDSFAADFADEHPSPGALSERLASLKARPGSLFLIARDRRLHPAGFLFVTPRRQAKLRHTADLNMGIRGEARGKGVGAGLVSAALSQLEAQGIIEIVYLMVRADNAAGVRLYRSHGFEAVATLARDTKIGNRYYDGMLMRRWIGR